jgi:hypothetical protein
MAQLSSAVAAERHRIASWRMSHALISLMDSPTMPVAWSGHLKSGQKRGCILASDEFYVVFEFKPITVMQMTGVMTQRTLPNSPIQYLYAASVFYRKSRNPHGPSSRPIYVYCLEYSEFTCRMKSQGFWASLSGEAREPAEVFSAHFFSGGRANMGQIPNNFTDDSALEFLMARACERLNVGRHQFTLVGPLTLGPDCAAIA